MRTPQPLVVDWTDAPADLNGLVRFAERRNLVSARLPSHFKRILLVLHERTDKNNAETITLSEEMRKIYLVSFDARIICNPRYIQVEQQTLIQHCYDYTSWKHHLPQHRVNVLMSKNARIVTTESISVRVHVPPFFAVRMCAMRFCLKLPLTPALNEGSLEVHHFQVRRSMSGVTVARVVSRLGFQEPSIHK